MIEYNPSDQYLKELLENGVVERLTWESIKKVKTGDVLLIKKRDQVDEYHEHRGRNIRIVNISETPVISDEHLKINFKGGGDVCVTPGGPYALQALVKGEIYIDTEDFSGGRVYRKLPDQNITIHGRFQPLLNF